MGLNMAPMPEVQQVIFRTSTKEIIVENPEVAVISLRGQKIFQVTGEKITEKALEAEAKPCLLYTSPSPRDLSTSRMPSSA